MCHMTLWSVSRVVRFVRSPRPFAVNPGLVFFPHGHEPIVSGDYKYANRNEAFLANSL
jgi:hypothetical protein